VRPRLTLTVLTLAAVLLGAATAHAFRLGEPLQPLPGNPANRLVHVPIEPPQYEPARGCDPRRRVGTLALVAWLQRNVRGQSWGTYRCERWGRRSASLHAENRAVDWHLNAADPTDARAARQLIHLLLAPDTAGNPHALARRMGVEEIIWDCSYWGAGMPEFRPYSPCFGRDGSRRRRVGATVAHRDHLHIGLTRAGAAGRTTFWLAVMRRAG
jgi:hypothetical protein